LTAVLGWSEPWRKLQPHDGWAGPLMTTAPG
jgi:hypothetical protein